jgi:hypothetical protein
MDAVLLGYLLKVAFDGIVGTQANHAVKHLCLSRLTGKLFASRY